MGPRSALFALAALLSFESGPTRAETVPHQFIAKTYTEALGRIPDSTGYGLSVQMFRQSGCSVELLRAWARQFYDSPLRPLAEYQSNYPEGDGATTADSVARILTVYRGILNREPTPPEFQAALRDYRASPWWVVLEGVLNSPEFAALAPKICSQDFYGFGGPQFPVIDVPFEKPAFEVLGCNPVCESYRQCRSDVPDAEALQLAMYCASQQAGVSDTVIVELAPQAVFRVHTGLVIPGNVVLRTRAPAGGWQWFPPRQYALMARLVRAGNFGGPMVRINRGAIAGPSLGRGRLEQVWVDGHRGPVEPNVPDLNVALSGGNGAEVFGCRINNSAGWTNILANGMSAGAECKQIAIRKNLITEYTSCHSKPDGPQLWSDGISNSCENAVIEDNQIVDVTDVGIVIYRGTESTTQRSVARRNSLLNSGNAAWAALVADPIFGPSTREYDFTGTRFEDNLIWTGDGHFDAGILVGTSAIGWSSANDIGRGATFVRNSLGWPALACSATVDLGIVVSGMLDATVLDNRLGLNLVDIGNCPATLAQCGTGSVPATAAVVASRCAGLASGNIQEALDFRVTRCLGHSPPHPDCSDGYNVREQGPFLWGEGPSSVSLDQVFPNPTRGPLVVRFTLLEYERAQLELLDITGRRVASREVGGNGIGPHEITLGESEWLPPGIYVVKLRKGTSVRMRQVVVLK